MTEPKRWLESGEAPHVAAALLATARPPRPLDAITRARSRRRLGAMTAIPAAAGVIFWIKSVALGAVLGSVVTATVVAVKWPERRAAPETTTARTAKAPPRAQTRVREAPTVEPEPESSAVPSAVPSVSTAPSVASASRAREPVLDPATENLEREIQLLERARQLMKPNPSLALSTLDQHRREFGSGTLVLERQFLEVDALLRLGRRDQAIARAADLRARAPNSLYERRLSKLLDPEQ